ncbi:MAG: transposase [Planctomycetes bacterium]|nr:transposase [Planctomycetota bacterium]
MDEILERAEGRIVTQRLVRADEPHFAGHYPDSPLMPGVLLCEACFQTGAMLLSGSAGLRPQPGSAGHRPAPDEGVPPSSSFLAPKDRVKQTGRGHLPHWDQSGATYFVTFRLADSLPEEARQRIDSARQEIFRRAEQESTPLTASEHEALDGLYTERMDEFLNAGHGACYLADVRCAQIVARAIQHFDNDRYVVYAWVVMPNHVHVVFRANPGRELAEIMHSWKSFTAKECNKVLGRSGEFWQREYFDRIVRDRADFERRVRYTLGNPSAAGLLDWQWVGGRAADGTSTADAGQRPALADAGQRPALPDAGQRPALPDAGQRPALPDAGQRPALPDAGQRPALLERKPVLTRILEAKFRGMVRPGDVLRIEVEQEEKMGDAYVMNGRVDVAGKNVLRVKFIVAMVEVPA